MKSLIAYALKYFKYGDGKILSVAVASQLSLSRSSYNSPRSHSTEIVLTVVFRALIIEEDKCIRTEEPACEELF